MNKETRKLLEQHFDTAFDAPDGIKKLRELILTLAMQGKLVPQDPNDQPASELLKEIEAEKKRLIKEGKIKQQKPLPPIKPEEIPYEIPKSWEWTRLENLCELVTDGTHHTPNYTESGVPFLSVKDLSSGFIDFSNTRFVSPIEHQELKKRCFPEKGDVLLTKVGTTGIAVDIDVEKEFSLFVSVALLKIVKPFTNPKFFTRLINSPLIRRFSEEGTEGVGNKNLVLRKIKVFLLPIPPLAEQQRIVEKIDQLMARVDELENLRKEREEKRLKIHKAAIDQLLSAKTETDFAAAWSFITGNFNSLYSVKENVAELRKAILQLAVMGKLVPQDPNDQPASELLKEIEAEKKRLIKEGKIKATKPLVPIKSEDIPFKLPSKWSWARLNDLTSLITKGSSPNWQGVNYTDKENGILFITSENVDNFKLRLDKKKYVEEKFNQIEPRSILQKNDVLMNLVGASIGRVSYYYLEDIANINQAVCLIRLIRLGVCLNLRYLLAFFNSEICISYMFDNQVENARANLSMTNVGKFVIPIPPVKEQQRIVEKVDALMELCDRLEQNLTDATEKQTNLLNSLMAKV